MAKRVGIAQLHDLVGEKPQGPVVVPRRCRRAGRGNHLRTLLNRSSTAWVYLVVHLLAAVRVATPGLWTCIVVALHPS